MAKLRITYNAPVVLTFALAAVTVFILMNVVEAVQPWVVAWPRLQDSHAYAGLFTHILGHGSWQHLLSNFTMILLLGPILEERHGSGSLTFMILVTALMTGITNLVIGDTFVLGASGIVFMMILLASTANIRAGEIPLTFIAVALIYLGGEVVRAFQNDQISQMAHLVGGVVGAVFGFLTAGTKARAKASVAPALPKLKL